MAIGGFVFSQQKVYKQPKLRGASSNPEGLGRAQEQLVALWWKEHQQRSAEDDGNFRSHYEVYGAEGEVSRREHLIVVEADSSQPVEAGESSERKETVRVAAYLVFPKDGDVWSADSGSHC